MTGRIHAFEPRPGGIYRMALTYGGPGHAAPGKTAQHTDIVRGRFLALIPDRQVAQLVEFESEDPAFAGERIGRAHVGTPVTNAHIVCRLLLDKKHKTNEHTHTTS